MQGKNRKKIKTLIIFSNEEFLPNLDSKEIADLKRNEWGDILRGGRFKDQRDEWEKLLWEGTYEEIMQYLSSPPSKNVQSPTPNWESRFISLFADILLSPRAREEWLGDLDENRQDLISRGRPRWVLILATLAFCVQMGWALFSIKYQDLVSSKKEQQVK